MATICPTVTATDVTEFEQQLDLVSSFAERIHIDVMDGDFAPTVSPKLDEIAIPDNNTVDIHIMYRHPETVIERLIALRPNLVIVHAESNLDIPKFAAQLRENGIKTGIALLSETEVASIGYLLPHVQHVLIFGGHLGYHGGTADLAQLEKVTLLKDLQPTLEIGWDGGVNLENIEQITRAGVEVINVGGAIHNSDNPETTYATMKAKLTSVK
jgi:ribulose-phosphate 3-epimerase